MKGALTAGQLCRGPTRHAKGTQRAAPLLFRGPSPGLKVGLGPPLGCWWDVPPTVLHALSCPPVQMRQGGRLKGDGTLGDSLAMNTQSAMRARQRARAPTPAPSRCRRHKRQAHTGGSDTYDRAIWNSPVQLHASVVSATLASSLQTQFNTIGRGSHQPTNIALVWKCRGGCVSSSHLL